MSYKTLYDSCNPPAGKTSNTKFIQPLVQPDYKVPDYVPMFEIVDLDIQTNKIKQHHPPPHKHQEKKVSTGSKNPKNWGPHLWYYLHTSAANFPKNPNKSQRRNMKQWLSTLATTIPCENCSSHYGAYINKHRHSLDDICSDKDKLFNFLVDCHNQVNKRHNKKIVNYDEARKMYPTSGCGMCDGQ